MNPDILERLRAAVRTVPDFPEVGIAFKDITPLLADAELLVIARNALSAPFSTDGITKVVGIESRGFILGAMIAESLGVGFVPVRKAGKLPYTTVSEAYELEYGTDRVEMHVDSVKNTDRVLVHDDVIATGGTAAATARMIESRGATVAGFSFLVELRELRGREKLHIQNVHSVLQY